MPFSASVVMLDKLVFFNFVFLILIVHRGKFVHIRQSPLCKGISEHPNFNLALRTYAVADVLQMQNRGIVTVDCVLYIKCVR